MAEENYEARNEMGPSDDGVHFFAHLEILGLKNANGHDDYNSLKEKVDYFVETSKAEIEKVQAEFKDEFGFGIGFRIDSDSFYVWTQNDYRLYQFDDLLQTVSILLVNGFKQGMPLRGVIGYGDFNAERLGKTVDVQDVSSFDDEELCRMVQNEAQDFGSTMNWSGVALTQKAWEEVKNEFARGKHEGWGRVIRSVGINSTEDLLERYLLSYVIPFEDGDCRKYNAVNWNYNPNDGLSEDVIRKAFEGSCVVFDEDAKTKLRKTLEFLDYTLNVAKSRRTFQNAPSTVAESDLLDTGEEPQSQEMSSIRGGGVSSAPSRHGCASDSGDQPRKLEAFLTI